VREPVGFVSRQISRRPVLCRYRLRGSGLPFYLRHATPDVNTFEQIFDEGHYDLPPPVSRALEGIAAPRAVDLGANIGMFGLWLRTRFPAARLVAFEPDPENAAVLARTAEANAGEWRLLQAAAGNGDGSVRFVTGRFANSHVASGGEEGVDVPLVDVFPYMDDADFVKIDIEGAEWHLTGDPRFSRLTARVVAFEYHPGDGLMGDPRAAAIDALRTAGYETVDGELETLPGHGMVWAWRSS
jgi:FkbM family methyltransferase